MLMHYYSSCKRGLMQVNYFLATDSTVCRLSAYTYICLYVCASGFVC